MRICKENCVANRTATFSVKESLEMACNENFHLRISEVFADGQQTMTLNNTSMFMVISWIDGWVHRWVGLGLSSWLYG